MNISAIRQALADAVDVIDGLNCFGYVPDSVPEPCFYVGEIELNRDLTFARTGDLQVKCRVLVSRADDKAGQQALDGYLATTGPASIWERLEGQMGVSQTLDGLVSDCVVVRVHGYRLYRVGDTAYYGAEFVVRVIE